MPTKNPLLRRKHNRLYYQKNKASIQAHCTAMKQSLLEDIRAIKAKTPCKDCGHTFNPVCMDFDHVSGTKIMSIAEMIQYGFSRAKIDEEIQKCELVCSNCHRIRTHLRNQN